LGKGSLMAIRILVVDDDSITRKFVSFILRSEGFEVIAAQDGMEALEMMGATEVDLMITDLNMPKMDGAELIQTIRNGSVQSDLPIIMLSTEADEDSRNIVFQAGVSDYMIKPVSRKVLTDKVRDCVKN